MTRIRYDLPDPATLPPPEPQRRPVPLRFYLGMALLYVLILGMFFSLESDVHRVVPTGRPWLVPLLAAGGFVLVASLFRFTFGRGRTSGRLLIAVGLLSLLIGGFEVAGMESCLVLAARGQAGPLNPLVEALSAFLHDALDANQPLAVHAAGALLVVPIEELVKLAPVFVLIAWRRIRTPQAALLAGGVAGVTFGIVESIVYAYGEYRLEQAPLTEYLIRFVNMSAVHGMWDAAAAAWVFFPAWPQDDGRRPAPPHARYVRSFIAVSAVHFLHNVLQLVIDPDTNIVTMLIMLAPIYALGRASWRYSHAFDADATDAIDAPTRENPRAIAKRGWLLPWPLVVLPVAGLLACAAHVAPPRAHEMLITWDAVATLGQKLSYLNLVRDEPQFRALSEDLKKWDLALLPPEVRDAHALFLATLKPFDDNEDGDGGGAGRNNFSAMHDRWTGEGGPRVGVDGVPADKLDQQVAQLAAHRGFAECRLRLNAFAAQRRFPPPSPRAQRWTITLADAQVAEAATLKGDPGDGREPFVVILLPGDAGAGGGMVPLARSPVLPGAPRPLPPLTFYAPAGLTPRLFLADHDPDAPGELLDYADLPAKAFAGDLPLHHGSTVRLKIEYAMH